MDKPRAALKALFYYYPIEEAFGMTVGGDKKGRFLTHFEDLAGKDASEFSKRELTLYKETMLQELKDLGCRCDNKIQLIAGLPLLFSERVLEKDKDGDPRVVFQNLFRWREVVKCLGEDIFTTAYLAKKDTKVRNDFCWPNVIGHNDDTINAALDKGLSDIHAHFGGAIDSFQFNWISLMNDVGGIYDRFKLMTFSYNDVVAYEKDYSFRKMAAWCRVAAAIRMTLFKTLVKGQKLKPTEEQEAILMLGRDGDTEAITLLKQRIDDLRTDGKKTREGVIPDYAITDDLMKKQNANSPYSLYAGERRIEYAFYKAYLGPAKMMNGLWIELFYLYELIKIHLRKEFVFSNDKWGLDNYNAFIARSELFTKEIQPICNLSSVQTSIRKGKNDYLESRVTPDSLGLTQGEYWKGLFMEDVFVDEDELKKRLSFIVQFTKSSKHKNKHREGRNRSKLEEVHGDYIKVTQFVNDKQSRYKIIGIDVGGSELSFRPEVFGHMLRSSKKQGFGITYHVGEEFFDLADGLRAIWEIVQFAKIGKGDRLGHCLALGIAVEEYYKKKHNTLLMPKQEMLDNMVWLCGFAKENGISIKPELKQKMDDLAKELYEEIGYGSYGALNMDDYYASMLLRSDDAKTVDGLDVWSETALLDSPQSNRARANSRARALWMAYAKDEDIAEKGEMPAEKKLGAAFAQLMATVQSMMRGMVIKTGVCIESCPSSNLQICKLERYDCHPAIKYYLKPTDTSGAERLNIAVCTDDKGTFSTSLSNEFSLLALAATKEEGWDQEMRTDFKKLIDQGNKYRFKTL